MNELDLALNNLQWLICHKTQTNKHIYIYIYMNKLDLALDNLQWLICHKTKPNQTKLYLLCNKCFWFLLQHYGPVQTCKS